MKNDDKTDALNISASSSSTTSNLSLPSLYFAHSKDCSSTETIIPKRSPFDRNDPLRKEVPFARRRKSSRVFARQNALSNQCCDFVFSENVEQNLLSSAFTSTSTITESISFFETISSFFENLSTNVETGVLINLPVTVSDNAVVADCQQQPNYIEMIKTDLKNLENLMTKLVGVLHLLVIHQETLFKKRETLKKDLEIFQQKIKCTDNENLTLSLAKLIAQSESKEEKLYNEWVKSIKLYNVCDEIIQQVQNKITSRLFSVIDSLAL